MKVTPEQIEKLAVLARIGLNEGDKEKYSIQLQSILDYFKKLEELNTEDVQETSHITGLENATREDEVIEPYDKEKVLNSAPELEKHCVKVRSVFNKSH